MDAISRRLDQLKRFIPEAGPAFFRAELEQLQVKLENDYLYVVVVGLFKRGKSSLINALLKADLAPVAVTPLTSVVTFFKYSEESYAEVQLTNEQQQRITLGEINDYVAEEKNPENIKGALSVTVFYPAPLLRRLILIDTPGLGSVYEHNSATTLSFVPKIDVALLVLSADMPVSKADTEFIGQMRLTVPKMLFVLNKSDLLTDGDLAQMISYDHKVITQALNAGTNEVPLIPVSASPVKNKFGTAALDNTLQDLVKNEKSRIIAKSVNGQVELLKQQLSGVLRLSLDNMLMPLNELEEKIRQFAAAKNMLTDNKSEFENLIAFKIKQIDQFVHHTVIGEAAKLEKTIGERVGNFFTERPGGHKGQVVLKQELDELMRETYNHARKELQAGIKSRFNEILAEHSQRAQSFFSELIRQFSQLMNLDMNRVTDQFDLDVYTSFYLTFDADRSLTGSRPQIWSRLFPELAVRQTEARWLDHYKKLLITNNAAVIYDLQYKSQEALRKFIAEINSELQDLLAIIHETMESTMNDKQRSQDLQQEKIRQLESQLAGLAAV